MDSKQIDRLMFHTPNDNSYLCADVGEVSLISTMKYNYTTSLPLTVDNTTMHALHVQFTLFKKKIKLLYLAIISCCCSLFAFAHVIVYDNYANVVCRLRFFMVEHAV